MVRQVAQATIKTWSLVCSHYNLDFPEGQSILLPVSSWHCQIQVNAQNEPCVRDLHDGHSPLLLHAHDAYAPGQYTHDDIEAALHAQGHGDDAGSPNATPAAHKLEGAWI